MDVDDFVEPEIAVTAAVTAALFSPRARKLLRKGLVYGTAGALVAGDALSSFTKSVLHAGAAAVSTAQETVKHAKEEEKSARTASQAAPAQTPGSSEGQFV